MRTRQKITNTTVEHEGRQYSIIFKPDGLHIRERFAREERIITLLELVSGPPASVKSPTKANPDYALGSNAEDCDIAACDLNLLAQELHQKKQPAKDALADVHLSVLRAMKIVRSLEVLA